MTQRQALAYTFTHAFALYIGAGVFAASLMGSAIPALNLLGKVYIMVTWPKVVYCAPEENGCDPLPPEWMNSLVFSFRGKP
jgi:hypothetical protein